jgi:hypothetical protein
MQFEVAAIIAAYQAIKTIVGAAHIDKPYTRHDLRWTAELVAVVDKLRPFIPEELLVGLPGEEK